VRPESPLRSTLEMLDSGERPFRARLGLPAGGWIGAAALTGDAALAEVQSERAMERWNLTRQKAGAYLMGSYAWQVSGLASACYVLGGRVPDVSPGNLAFPLDDHGLVSGVALIGGNFACLPDDPDRESPHATVLPDEEAQLGWLRERLEAGLEPLAAVLQERTGARARTLWNRASDMVAHAFLLMAGEAEDPLRCGVRVETLVKTPGSPLRANNAFFTVEHAGRGRVFMTRSVCCQAYRSAGYGYCDSCPVLSQRERERRAREELARGTDPG
jgi:hypothetical protein